MPTIKIREWVLFPSHSGLKQTLSQLSVDTVQSGASHFLGQLALCKTQLEASFCEYQELCLKQSAV